MTDDPIGRQSYVESLVWRQKQIQEEISSLQAEIKNRFELINNKQEQLSHVVKLLMAEGDEFVDPELTGVLEESIADIAYEYMRGMNNPLHYSEMAKGIMSKGILIPGKNPEANLLSHIGRDNRFVRTSPGTYGLSEWGLKSVSAKRKKRRRKRN